MRSNYESIICDNLIDIYGNLPEALEEALPAVRVGNLFHFRAFGEDCILGPDEIILSWRPETGPEGLLISLYAVNASPLPIQLEPFKSFKDLPSSMPYQGAFSVNSERILIPSVPLIRDSQETIMNLFNGERTSSDLGGDFAFYLFPLPKIALCYLFYLPDEEFPASVTCLNSSNAPSLMPLAGLADVGEYTSRRLLSLIDKNTS